jgi:acyl-CoA reductase-like NAD-dependent aldehyde dehydrogenase
MDMKTSPLALLKDPSLIKTDALINRQWVNGSNRFNIHDPAKGAKLANVANLRTVRYQSGCHCTEDVPYGGVKQSGLANKPIYLRINSMYRNWSTT